MQWCVGPGTSAYSVDKFVVANHNVLGATKSQTQSCAHSWPLGGVHYYTILSQRTEKCAVPHWSAIHWGCVSVHTSDAWGRPRIFSGGAQPWAKTMGCEALRPHSQVGGIRPSHPQVPNAAPCPRPGYRPLRLKTISARPVKHKALTHGQLNGTRIFRNPVTNRLVYGNSPQLPTVRIPIDGISHYTQTEGLVFVMREQNQ